MSNFISTPLMNLPNPVPGVDPGPDYANNLQSSLNIIDQHNHSPGFGNQINPSGININTDLAFNLNNATLLRSVRFSLVSPTPAGPADLGCLYIAPPGDLYYTNTGGQAVQLTNGNTVNVISSGLANPPASANFVSGVLVVDANTNTPGNIQGGSFLLGNNVSGSNFLTLSPPSAMGSSYSLVLPALPSSLQFVTLDTSGNLATASSVQGTQIATGSITGTQLANQTVTSTQIANATVGTAQLAPGSVTTGIQATATSSVTNWSTTTTSTTGHTVPSGSTSITASGVRPILVSIACEASGGISFSNTNTGVSNASATLAVLVNGTTYNLTYESASGDSSNYNSGYPVANSWVVFPTGYPTGSPATFSVGMSISANAPTGGITTVTLIGGFLTVVEL
jgi:hypothetical protein